jgi:NADP-dependent 3-hydroxy acid dehydrogenase YdfG
LQDKKAHTAEVDVTSPDSIQRFKSSLGDIAVDLLLNIAGAATHENIAGEVRTI